MTEIIEAEVRPLPVIHEGISASGSLALAALTDDEFDRRLAALEKGADRIARIQKALMRADVDYGVIPGTKKPTLLKPGAEKLCLAYSLAADFRPDRTLGDSLVTPAISYLTRCDLHLGDLDGPIVAVGYGAANSWEPRYRYRTADRVCPSCSKEGTIRKSKRDPEWYCWAKLGGCGATFALSDASIVDQDLGKVENPDPWDLDVTLAKMAEKRAHVDATLRATGASALFTQDMEDRKPDPEAPPAERTEPDEYTDGGTLIGTAVKQSALTTDFVLRTDPEGVSHLGFRLKAGAGTGVICEVVGPMADALEAFEADVIGQRVEVWGEFVPHTTTSGITYRAWAVSRIKCAAFELPAAGAPSMELGLEAELDAIGA